MNKFVITLALIVSALLAAASFGLWRVDRDLSAIREQVAQAGQGAVDQMSGGRAETAQRLDVVEMAITGVNKNLAELNVKMEGQNMLVNRSLGNVLPYKMPSNIETRIKSVQDRIDSAIQSRIEPAAVEQLRSDLAGIVGDLPPWAQEEFLPRLVPMRWELESLWTLGLQPGRTFDELTGRLAIVDGLLADRPLGSSDELAKQLEDGRVKLTAQIAAAERADAMAKGTLALREKKEMETAVMLLSSYNDNEAKQLVDELKKSVRARSIQDSVKTLATDIRQFNKIADPALRMYALERAKAAAYDVRLQAYSLSVSSVELEKALKSVDASLATAITLAVEAQRVKYQVWALNQIKQVRTLKQVQQNVSDKDVAKGWLEDEMITFLAPIDEAYLDVAVRDWFGKIYAQRLADLKDPAEQIRVVQGFANTPKKVPDELP